LASTAIGVVGSERAGMASGINSTLRQVGIAPGVATLGTLLGTHLRDAALTRLQAGPLNAQAHELATAIGSGRVSEAIGSTQPQLRGLVADAAVHGFATALNDILLVSAATAFAAAVATLVLIRSRDFVAHQDESGPMLVAVG